MSKIVQKQLDTLYKKEQKLLSKTKHPNILAKNIEDKIPPKLNETLESAFSKAFELVFLKGTDFIEKTYNKQEINTDFNINNYAINTKTSKATIKNIDKSANKDNLLNNTFTTVSGIGMGVLGIGLPDIPLLISVILKGIYQISSGYGYDYNTLSEKIYILRLIRTAVCNTDAKHSFNFALDNMPYGNIDLNQEINFTAKELSHAMLTAKFIQGIPIIGAVGGFNNCILYKKITDFASIKYKKRYLGKIVINNYNK